jgi:GT2 family glycosyltransferase
MTNLCPKLICDYCKMLDWISMLNLLSALHRPAGLTKVSIHDNLSANCGASKDMEIPPEVDSESSNRSLVAADCTISVVVPTFNRRDDLLRLLESLWQQTLSRDQFEVIVACDGSNDGTIEMVRQCQIRTWNLRLLELPNRGPATARNSGAKAALGRYLAFTDDDCVVAPDWLVQILEAFQATGAVAIQGRTTTNRASRTPLTHEIEVLEPRTTTVPTCNAAYLKSVFDAAGGFDEHFPFPHDEDTDLAWRVEDLGAIVFASAVHVLHPPRRDTFWKRARWVRMWQSDFLLYQKNPVKYKRYIGPSPWWTIYWTVFVMHQLRFARSCFRFVIISFQPQCFLQGLTLLVARWFGLIWYFPEYFRAQKTCRARPETAA